MSSQQKSTSPPAARASQDSGRRRSSQGGLFANLQGMKRDPASEAHAARRQSVEDQGRPQGMLGSMWNNFTKGPSGEKK